MSFTIPTDERTNANDLLVNYCAVLFKDTDDAHLGPCKKPLQECGFLNALREVEKLMVYYFEQLEMWGQLSEIEREKLIGRIQSTSPEEQSLISLFGRHIADQDIEETLQERDICFWTRFRNLGLIG